MPRRNRRKQRDLDFEIHVDPSCLSAPMDEKSEIQEVSVKEVGEIESSINATDDTQIDTPVSENTENEPSPQKDEETEPGKVEDEKDTEPLTLEAEQNTNEPAVEEEKPTEAPPPPTDTEYLGDEPLVEAAEPTHVPETEIELAVEAPEPAEVPEAKAEPVVLAPEPTNALEAETEPGPVEEDLQEQKEPELAVEEVEPTQPSEETPQEPEEPEVAADDIEPTQHIEEAQNIKESLDDTALTEPQPSVDIEAAAPEADVEAIAPAEESPAEEEQLAVEVKPEALLVDAGEETIATQESEAQEPQAEVPVSEESHLEAVPGDADTEASYSRRESGVSASTRSSSRRTSKRTEALIQAAARDIVAQMERNRNRDSFRSSTSTENASYISRSARSSHVDERSVSDRQSYMSESRAVDDAGDSSSHHDDDVFSDHSPRSSMGSTSETDHRKMEDDMSYKSRSPRISNISQYDHEEDFVPTVRGTPRPPFRSPSSVKALQMSSPPASVIGSPRSSRRTPLPTVSRNGSPSLSAQYSPKKTPPRFRRSTPPLVLLHVTLLPLRWAWGDVLDSASTDELSEDTKTLREAWRHLQDRLGDTVCERGILLPHPQGDYEILEERLLEALELPMRRRARILECGHYLGPSNDFTLTDDADSSDDDDENYYDGVKGPRDSMERKTHWCSTCRSDIRYDSLGPGKIFRVKVYASNGLMKAGAWEACWKEMERVDVELEPIVESGVQDELNRIAAEQEQALELREVDEMEEEEEEEEDEHHHHHHHDEELPESSFLEHHEPPPQLMPAPSSPPPPEIIISSSPPTYDERRRREEERFKEIYGHSPPKPMSEPAPPSSPPRAPEFMQAPSSPPRAPEFMQAPSSPPRAPEFMQAPSSPPRAPEFMHESPPSPSVHAFERREERRQVARNDSLPELLLEAARVLLQDRKNVMIALLSVFVLMLALRGGSAVTHPGPDPRAFETLVPSPDVATVTVTQAAVQHTVDPVQEVLSVSSAVSAMGSQSSEASAPTQAEIPAMSEEVQVPPPRREPETIVSEKVIRLVETVTETAVETIEVTATYTQTETAPSQSETVAAKNLEEIEPAEVEQVEGESAEVEHAKAEDVPVEVVEVTEVETEQQIAVEEEEETHDREL